MKTSGQEWLDAAMENPNGIDMFSLPPSILCEVIRAKHQQIAVLEAENRKLALSVSQLTLQKAELGRELELELIANHAYTGE